MPLDFVGILLSLSVPKRHHVWHDVWGSHANAIHAASIDSVN